MSDKPKHKPAWYIVDFITALPVTQCVARLERLDALPNRGLGGSLAPVRQRTRLQANRTFTVERTYPGAIHPIRLVGHLDPDAESDGTWVHGAITHDAQNQVLIEGMIVFLAFFLLTALLYLRLRTRGLVISGPLLLATLVVLSARWRALSRTTEDLARWLRRKLYVTAEQVK